MKKIFILLLIFSSLGIASAVEYPESINNGKKMISTDDFRGIYKRIYEDINNEDLVEVCERTLRWPDFWKKNREGKNESFYSVKNCKNLSQKNSLTDNFLNLANKNFKDFNNLKKDFKIKFKLEKDLLQKEINSQRKSGLAYIFANGAEDQKNSPFDLVSDLNEIDKVFFGEMHERPKFEFIATSEQIITKDFPSENSDIWLKQIAENLAPKMEKFSDPLESFAGSLWSLGVENFREKLNSYDLSLAHIPKTANDTSFAEGISTGSGMTADTHSVPAESNDSPESLGLDKLLYNPLPTLNSFITDYILVQSSYKDKSDLSINEKIKNVIFSNKVKNELIKIDLQNFKKDNSRESENINFQSKTAILNRLEQIIDLFREKMKIIRKDVIPDFLKKPQYSS